MSAGRVLAIALRQLYLMRGSPARVTDQRIVATEFADQMG